MSTNGDIDSGVLLPDLLDLDLAELDDEEYNIPPVEKTPTLESILNDDESSLISEEELSNYLPQELLTVGFDDHFETSSVSSLGSRGGHSPAYRKHAPNESILRHVLLKNISSHLQATYETEDGGLGGALGGAGPLVVVGSTHGLVLCYDAACRTPGEIWRIEERNQGGVTAVTVNPQATRVLVGFARGLVLMLDAADGRKLRVIPPDAHTPSTAVVHLRFTDFPSVALLSDSGGSVFEVSLKRVLGVRSWDVRCVFSGSRGEVLALEPLYSLPSHPLAGSVILAMATLSKLLLISLRPETRLLFTFPTAASPLSLPLLSWQFVVIQVADSSRVMDPVLAFARDDIIHFFQVSVEGCGRVGVHALQSISVSYSLVSSHWLTPRTLALVDTKETLRLLDVRSRAELESLDISSVGLVYNTSAFKAIATGGNVSKAMALAGQRACYNSIQSFGSQLLILGTKSIHSISIRIWTERINNLILQNRFSDALKLAMDFYEERGKAVLGLRGPKPQRQKLVKEKVLDTLVRFIDRILDGSEAINYHEAIPLVIEHCLDLDQRELVFGRLWLGLEETGRTIFLEGILTVIVEGKLTEPPPEVMQNLITNLEFTHRFKELEECIQRVEILCLDIEQAITVCKQQGLYNGLISVWNRAMGDYTSPLYELLPILQSHIQGGNVDEEGRKLGNLLLVYVANCLGGGGPKGSEHARQQVLRALCTQHSQCADDSEHCFPYIRTLLEFDTREFLNALAIAFSDPALTQQMRQRLVDILVQVMTEGTSFKCTQVGWLVWLVGGRGLRVDSRLGEGALARLATEEDPPKPQREQAFLQLISSNSLDISKEQLLATARIAQFYDVCAVLHEERCEHGEVVRYRLMDPARREQAFAYLEQCSNKEALAASMPQNINGLLDTDAKRTGQILVRHFPQIIMDILPEMSGEPLYLFLQGMLEESDLDQELMTKYVCLMCEFEPSKALQVVRNHDNIELDPAIRVAREYNLEEVLAVLLERSGDIQGAFDVLLKRLQNSIGHGDNVDSQTEELVNLAQRGNSVLDSKTSWLPLLMCLLQLNSHELLQRVLSNADLNLVSELHLLMQHTQGKLGDLRSLIMGLFVKCREERRMVEAIRRLRMSDLHADLKCALRDAARGVLVKPLCNLCSQPFPNGYSLFLFRCGHGYHSKCIAPRSTCVECFKSD